MVLDADPLAVEPDAVKDIYVLATWSKGKQAGEVGGIGLGSSVLTSDLLPLQIAVWKDRWDEMIDADQGR